MRVVTPERALRLRLVALTAAILVLAGLLAVWVDYLGVYDIRTWIQDKLHIQRERRVESPYLLRERELEKREEAIDVHRGELDRKELALAAKEQEIERREQGVVADAERVTQREKNLIEKKKRADSYDGKVKDLAGKIVQMRPEEAVARLGGLGEDLLIIDVLRRIDQNAAGEGKMSVVPYYFSLMDQATASRLMRKMLREE
jgi:hypothetical protein